MTTIRTRRPTTWLTDTVQVIHAHEGPSHLVKHVAPDSPTLTRTDAVRARISHPRAIVGVPLVDRTGLALPYIASPSLDRTSPPHDLLRVLEHAIELLEHLHNRGVVHRDVKPANLIDHEGELYLIDFGSAVCQPSPLGSPEGSPAYMAPEVLLQWSTDPAVDVWALITTVYELHTGSLPFDHGTLAVDLAHKRAGRWAPVRGPDAAWWNRLFAKGFAPHPADRWSLRSIRAHLLTAEAPRRAVASVNRSVNALCRGSERQR